MTDMKFKKMYETIEAHLMQKYGVAFLALSKETRCDMIAHTFHEYLREQRERQG
jgi:hypothetical protein